MNFSTYATTVLICHVKVKISIGLVVVTLNFSSINNSPVDSFIVWACLTTWDTEVATYRQTLLYTVFYLHNAC